MTNSIGEIRDADFLFVIGSNTSEAHPIIAMEMKRAVRRGATLVVADPRAIWMTSISERHLQLKPGTDIWLLNAFDLTMTIMAHEHGLLDEQNPFAREMLEAGVLPIMLYKVGLVFLGSYPLVRFRRHRICELGALVVLAAYALLAVRWSTCYDLYSLAASDSVNLAEFNLVNRGFP